MRADPIELADGGNVAVHQDRGWVLIGDSTRPRGGGLFDSEPRYCLHSFRLQSGELQLVNGAHVPYGHLVVDSAGVAILCDESIWTLRWDSRNFERTKIDGFAKHSKGVIEAHASLTFLVEEGRDARIVVFDRISNDIRGTHQVRDEVVALAGNGEHVAWALRNECCVETTSSLNGGPTRRVDIDRSIRCLARSNGHWWVGSRGPLYSLDESGISVVLEKSPFAAIQGWKQGIIGHIPGTLSSDKKSTPSRLSWFDGERLRDVFDVPIYQYDAEAPVFLQPLNSPRIQSFRAEGNWLVAVEQEGKRAWAYALEAP